MYKPNFPNYGSNTVIIEMRSSERFATHFKVIGHWNKDGSNKEQVIKDAREKANAICVLLNRGDLHDVLELVKENQALKDQKDIVIESKPLDKYYVMALVAASGIMGFVLRGLFS